MSPAKVKDDLSHIRRDLEQTALQPGRHAHRLHPDGPRWAGDQPARGGLFQLRLGHAQAGGAAHAAPNRRLARPHALRSAHRGPHRQHPIHTAEFDSNWELSSARATRIARLFLDLKALPPERISAAGYAEFHPVASNDTAEGRARNRRVDLVVLPRTKIDLSAPESRSRHRRMAQDHRR
jgi:hypothetical protein